jgi:hypothetical protein
VPVGEYDNIGKHLLRLAAGERFTDSGPSVSIDFGPGAGRAAIDGTVAGIVAVEVESRVPKQVRGALIDLILHPYEKKMLLLIPVHTGNPNIIFQQAQNILGRFVDAAAFRVVMATDDPNESVRRIRTALVELGALGQ